MSLPAILRQLNAGKLNQIKAMMQMVNGSGNPQAMLAQLSQTNPNVKKVMDIVQQYGGDPNKAFYALAEQNGINPQEILDLLK